MPPLAGQNVDILYLGVRLLSIRSCGRFFDCLPSCEMIAIFGWVGSGCPRKSACIVMGFRFLPFLLYLLATGLFIDSGSPVSSAQGREAVVKTASLSGEEVPEEGLVSVYLIPIEGEIGPALLFVLRRGMKEAIELGADVLVLEMDTPGGRLDVTLDIMEMLSRFDGRTITYVNTEAISAGAFISAATNEIWYAPRGIIGAAAPVSATGEDIPETMKLKLMSYLTARMESFTEGVPYRTEVLRAMMDSDYELEIDGTVIKPKGELLTLTASKAIERYGESDERLFGDGIAVSLEELFIEKFGKGGYTIDRFVPTWSEELARWLTAISPLLLGVGLLCLFVEIKTPGFGLIGGAGIVLLALVFFGHHLAGLSGMEPLLIFLVGILLILVELFLLPGLIFPAVLGVVLMIGALLWGMADIWPGDAFELTPDLFVRPVVNLAVGLLLAIIGMLAVARFLPRSWFWDKMILDAGIAGTSQSDALSAEKEGVAVGAVGIAVTDLYPSGEIEIDGKRYQARLDYGSAQRGDEVEVRKVSNFELQIRRKSR